MEYVVASFRSRAQTVKFYGILKNAGVNCEVVNTPKEAGVGCGLSVKFKKEAFPFVKRAVIDVGFNSFAGFFLVKNAMGMRIVKSI